MMMMFERESVCESERIHTHIQNKVKFNKKWTKIARVSADTTQSKGLYKGSNGYSLAMRMVGNSQGANADRAHGIKDAD